MKKDYQYGSLRVRKHLHGPPLWQFRYRVTGDDGVRRHKSVIVGRVDVYPTEAAIRERIQDLVVRINRTSPYGEGATVDVAIDRFIKETQLREITDRKAKATGPDLLHYATAGSYLSMLNRHIRPRWGDVLLHEVKTLAVQEWLKSLPVAPKTKGHIKALMRRLFEKALVWEMLCAPRNPIDQVELRGTSKRLKVPTVLTVEQFHEILSRCSYQLQVMVILAVCTGLRVSEILGLQWNDVDFDRGTLSVTRGVVSGHVNDVKTEYSRDLLPLDPALAAVLLAWRDKAYPNPEGWLFANPKKGKPLYACSIEHRHFKRIGAELGISLGWHTFRHTYRSWLDATGAPMGVQQKLMRHAQISTTMNVYGNALMQSKRDANSQVVHLALGFRQALPAPTLFESA